MRRFLYLIAIFGIGFVCGDRFRKSPQFVSYPNSMTIHCPKEFVTDGSGSVINSSISHVYQCSMRSGSDPHIEPTGSQDKGSGWYVRLNYPDRVVCYYSK
jgi:hypothetical protein